MRRIKQNVWGNWNGYEGTRKVHEFGTDGDGAREWLNNIPAPEPLNVSEQLKDLAFEAFKASPLWGLAKNAELDAMAEELGEHLKAEVDKFIEKEINAFPVR